MKIFISIEAQNAIESGLADILRDTINELAFLTKNDNLIPTSKYGRDLNEISIIPTCVDDCFWNILGWKERVLVRKSKKEAEIRLRMNYDVFMQETYQNKRLLFIANIIESIQSIQKKYTLDFDGEKLADDILHTLNVSKDLLSKTVEKTRDGSVVSK